MLAPKGQAFITYCRTTCVIVKLRPYGPLSIVVFKTHNNTLTSSRSSVSGYQLESFLERKIHQRTTLQYN